MIALAQSYACVMGGPVLRGVDPAIFTLRYFTHCMTCGFCHDACCDHGVDIDLENAARLRALDRLPVAIVSVYPYINAVVAMGVGWVFFREPFGVREFAAMLIIFFGVGIVRTVKRTPDKFVSNITNKS